MNIGNKILIMGGSCSGKSTLSENLAKKLNIPVLHLDLYDPYALPEGAERNIRKKKIQSVIKDTIKSKKWIIDGTYEWYSFKERLDSADTLILLYSPAPKRIFNYVKSCVFKIKRHGRNGFSAKNFRIDHVWYMLKKSDAPYNMINKAIKEQTNLRVIKLNSFKAINEFVNNIQIKSK